MLLSVCVIVSELMHFLNFDFTYILFFKPIYALNCRRILN